MWYVGLDVHLRSTVESILGANGKWVKQRRFRGHTELTGQFKLHQQHVV